MIDPQAFENAVQKLAEEDGVEFLLSIPGVWEPVQEFYNNEAIKLLEDGWMSKTGIRCYTRTMR